MRKTMLLGTVMSSRAFAAAKAIGFTFTRERGPPRLCQRLRTRAGARTYRTGGHPARRLECHAATGHQQLARRA